ncbi:hypothetical protein [Herbidospora mongoliensis]|uniref:hypothetical protein n=1 Tax=Herbidospora mongoliensis TaxID=688067 RepID=UPI000836CCFF|nr:hypothetical protein [Herbidospora mongoliensis]
MNWTRFVLHYLEMVIAMFAGMFLLGLITGGWDLGPEAGYLVMAVNMSIGMAVVMVLRGHSWPRTLEMCAAMFAPAVIAFPLFWAGAVDDHGLMMIAHVVMFPLMLAVMLRRREDYVHAHH